MMWGETAPPGRSPQMVELPMHEPQTMAEVRARLEKILSEGVEVEHDGLGRPRITRC